MAWRCGLWGSITRWASGGTRLVRCRVAQSGVPPPGSNNRQAGFAEELVTTSSVPWRSENSLG